MFNKALEGGGAEAGAGLVLGEAGGESGQERRARRCSAGVTVQRRALPSPGPPSPPLLLLPAFLAGSQLAQALILAAERWGF